jgi:nitrilase
MSAVTTKYKAAVVQATPVFLDKDGCIEKTCKLIEEAGKNGARLVVFPETFIPTYPYWMRDLVDRTPCYEVFVQYFRNSIAVPSKEAEKLAESAKKAGAWAVIGISEVGGSTLYNSNLYLSDKGEVMGTHRKLLPTFTERAIWGWGDGSTLYVFDTGIGKLGSLVCYEHHMPLTKFAMFSKGEQVHAACWPGLKHISHVIEAASRQYAFEGQTFVLASASLHTEGTIPDSFLLKDYIMKANGGSAIIDPMGFCLAGPIYDREEVLYAEIDLDRIIMAKYIFDVVGHYCRPDVAKLLLNEEKFKTVLNTVSNESPLGEVDVNLVEASRNLKEISNLLKKIFKKLNKLTKEELIQLMQE